MVMKHIRRWLSVHACAPASDISINRNGDWNYFLLQKWKARMEFN